MAIDYSSKEFHGYNLVKKCCGKQGCCCSVTKSNQTLGPHGRQHGRLPCPSVSPRVCSNSCPLSW